MGIDPCRAEDLRHSLVLQAQYPVTVWRLLLLPSRMAQDDPWLVCGYYQVWNSDMVLEIVDHIANIQVTRVNTLKKRYLWVSRSGCDRSDTENWQVFENRVSGIWALDGHEWFNIWYYCHRYVSPEGEMLRNTARIYVPIDSIGYTSRWSVYFCRGYVLLCRLDYSVRYLEGRYIFRNSSFICFRLLHAPKLFCLLKPLLFEI